MRKGFDMAICVRLAQVSLAVLLIAVEASATPQDYCAAYARDFADQGTKVQWQSRKDNALADCLLTVSPVATPAPQSVVKPKPVAAAKPIALSEAVEAVTTPEKIATSKPILATGSIAWLDYCEKKYASFSRTTGTYISYKGVERKCLVTAE